MMELEPIMALHNQGVTQDLDLIEVLWRQDIDLGVGKEVFDPNLRRELEREREIELQKERQKQKEQELVQKKLEEQRVHAQQRWLHDNFTQDGETGEWVPLGGNRVPPPPPAPDLTTVVPEGEQFLSNFDNMPLLSDEIQQTHSNNYPGVPPPGNHMPPQYQGSQPIHPQSSQMYGADQYGQNSSAVTGYGPQQSNVNMLNVNSYAQTQQTQYNNNQNYNQSQQNYSQLQNVQQQQQPPQQQPQQANYPRQSSLEATWQDLVNILDLPPNQTRPNNESRSVSAGMMMNNSVHNANMSNLDSSIHNPGMSALDNTSSILIQNASMPTPAPMNGNITFNNTGLVSQRHRSPPLSTGMMSPGQNFNSSIPNGSSMNPLEWEPCGDFLFPNITTDLNQTEPLEEVDELLPDLITEDELDEINFAEMELNDGMTRTPSSSCSDDGSSDSAVSMGSQSAGSPEMNDFSDGAMSPFDGMEGATGGHDGSSFSKTSKYDPDDYKYGRSCSYSCGDSNSSNFSSSSNDTNQYGHGGGGGGHIGSPNNGHINHNHSYPLKPGADPKDIKRHIFNNNKEGRHKGPQSKDRKKINELKIPFTLDQIVSSPVEEFNDMLTRHKLNDQQLQLIRDIRRRGKNKVAAQNCRKRKLGVLEHLEDEMTTLEKMRDKLMHERHLMDKNTREMKEKLGNLYSEIFHSLRDEHGQPYDPSRYSLQQSSDGDVFLVPRNYTMEEDINKKRKNDRK